MFYWQATCIATRATPGETLKLQMFTRYCCLLLVCCHYIPPCRYAHTADASIQLEDIIIAILLYEYSSMVQGSLVPSLPPPTG